MRITDEQHQLLLSLKVERLRDNKANVALVNTFKSKKNPVLEQIITTRHAFDKDREGTTAYYVVKGPDGTLLLYFSLKCGELFENLDMRKMQIAKATRDNIDIISNPDKFDSETVHAAQLFIKDNWAEILSILPNLHDYADKKGHFKSDVTKELNSEISRVLKTYPAIELVEFCKNDNANDKWKEFGLPQKIGECVFWYHIVPILKSVQEIIGCEYVYLFAADNTEDRFLANYYQVALHFENSNKLGANKPHYDFMCYFLHQKISDLDKGVEEFKNNFNPDEDIV
jgi:hypothetical protein